MQSRAAAAATRSGCRHGRWPRPVAAGAFLFTGGTRVGSIVSLVVAVVHLIGTGDLMRDSIKMSVDAVLAGLKLEVINAFLKQQPGSSAIYDLYVRFMSTTEIERTHHWLTPGGRPGDEVFARLALDLKQHFKIDHWRIQVETDENSGCMLEPGRVV